MIKKLGSLSISVVLFCTFVLGFDIPKYDGYVTDMAGVLSTDAEISIEKTIEDFGKKTDVELAVLIVKNLDGEDIAMKAVEIGQNWGVGDKKKDNGIMILISIEDKKRFIAVGYGLEGTITDAIAKRVGEAQFPSNFRAGNYYLGISSVLSDIFAYILKDPSIVEYYNNADSSISDGKKSNFGGFLTIAIFLGILLGSIMKGQTTSKRYITGAVGLPIIVGLILLFAIGMFANAEKYLMMVIGNIVSGVSFLGAFLQKSDDQHDDSFDDEVLVVDEVSAEDDLSDDLVEVALVEEGDDEVDSFSLYLKYMRKMSLLLLRKFMNFLYMSSLCMIFFSGYIFSFQFPVNDNSYVMDQALILSSGEESSLESLIYDFWKSSNTEVGVLITTGIDYEDPSLLATNIGQSRGIGDAKYDNGIMLLVSIQDRKWAIAVGYGLEGTITDATAKKIGEKNYPYYFKQGSYYSGLYYALNDIFSYIRKDTGVMALYSDSSDYGAVGSGSGTSNGMILVIGLFIYFILGLVLSSKYIAPQKKGANKRYIGEKGWINYGLLGLGMSSILALITSFDYVLGSFIGSYLVLIVCVGLMFVDGKGGGSISGSSWKSSSSSSRSSSSGSSRSGSSFGGYSGGSFGGGGASGSW